MGFHYRIDTYSLSEVIKSKGGNCLGYPMLIGAILSEHGFDVRYRMQTNPKDAIADAESKFAEELLTGQYYPYHYPQLARRDEPKDQLRFTNLDHLAIHVDDSYAIETTCSRDRCFKADAEQVINFTQAAALIDMERSLQMTCSGEFQGARDAIDRSLLLWCDNILAWEISAILSFEYLDTESFYAAKSSILRIQNGTSRDMALAYKFTEDNEYIKRSFEENCCDAQSVALYAYSLRQTDPREAAFLFSVASHLFSQSSMLKLGSFYTTYAPALCGLFEAKSIKQILNSFAATQRGDLRYHLTQYQLTDKPSFLASALEAETIRTPRQKLEFFLNSRGTKYYDQRQWDELHERFGRSDIYNQLLDAYRRR
jgi:hypothetical protein